MSGVRAPPRPRNATAAGRQVGRLACEHQGMPTTSNGDVELYYETFGSGERPTLLLVNGLGSQCINIKVELCERFVERGLQVVRFDNRDVGLSSHLKGGPKYNVDDMARDGFAVLDA